MQYVVSHFPFCLPLQVISSVGVFAGPIKPVKLGPHGAGTCKKYQGKDDFPSAKLAITSTSYPHMGTDFMSEQDIYKYQDMTVQTNLYPHFNNPPFTLNIQLATDKVDHIFKIVFFEGDPEIYKVEASESCVQVFESRNVKEIYYW